MADSQAETRQVQDEFGKFCTQKKKMMITCQKDTGANVKGAPTGQMWDN